MSPTQQKPGNTFIEPPDKVMVDQRLFCALDRSRVCVADCVAFDRSGVAADDRTTCIIVNAMKQQAVAAATSAKVLFAKQISPGVNVPPEGIRTS